MARNVQTQLQNSWQNLANDSAQVISARLSMLPWQWMMNPGNAQAETQRMFSEKHDAFMETQMLMWQAPINFWLDAMNHGLSSSPHMALTHATNEASKRLMKPSSSRARANRKRLSAR